MSKKLFIGNWKSHKTVAQTHDFMWQFAKLVQEHPLPEAEIIICPSFTSLQQCSEFVRANNLPIEIGAQNISAFEAGAYTGEVNAQQVKEYATHVIIGHSERKRLLGETGEDIGKKVHQAHDSGLTVILCVQDENDTVVDGVKIIAYEPPSAIGSGVPDTPEHIAEVFEKLHEKYAGARLLYGGSVNEKDVKQFLAIPHLQGFLIGGASLEPQRLHELISLC